MICDHDLGEMETACADGQCPICASAALTRADTENERLRAFIESLDGKYICIKADDGFIDDGIIVAADIVREQRVEAGPGYQAAPVDVKIVGEKVSDE